MKLQGLFTISSPSTANILEEDEKKKLLITAGSYILNDAGEWTALVSYELEDNHFKLTGKKTVVTENFHNGNMYLGCISDDELRVYSAYRNTNFDIKEGYKNLYEMGSEYKDWKINE